MTVSYKDFFPESRGFLGLFTEPMGQVDSRARDWVARENIDFLSCEALAEEGDLYYPNGPLPRQIGLRVFYRDSLPQ